MPTIYAIFSCFLSGPAPHCYFVEAGWPTLALCEKAMNRYVYDPEKRYGGKVSKDMAYKCVSRPIATLQEPF